MEFPITKDYFILKEGDERVKYRVYYYDTETHADRELHTLIPPLSYKLCKPCICCKQLFNVFATSFISFFEFI